MRIGRQIQNRACRAFLANFDSIPHSRSTYRSEQRRTGFSLSAQTRATNAKNRTRRLTTKQHHQVYRRGLYEFRGRKMPADSELNSVLMRRQEINNALDNGDSVKVTYRVVNVYTEFHEFTRKEIKQYEAVFKRFNTNKDNFLSLTELKRMMEVLGAPQTHLGLKTMIKEVDEDGDGRLSFREFLLVYRKAKAGELDEDSGLGQLAKLTEIDVDKVGVNGAKNFFEAKIEEQKKVSKFESEIREEQEERKRIEDEKALRRQQFLQKAAMFK